LMRRRVRVAEFYVGYCANLRFMELYDENSDSFASLTKATLDKHTLPLNSNAEERNESGDEGDDRGEMPVREVCTNGSYLLIRPNIEHYMLGVIIGRGGIDHLGATLWGQTEMSVFDDGQHGVWGMTYKYHERAIVFNERNLHRVWDVAYDGYVGGKDMQIVDMNSESDIQMYIEDANNYSVDYGSYSIISTQLKFEHSTLPSPLPLSNYIHASPILATADTFINDATAFCARCVRKAGDPEHQNDVASRISEIYQKLDMNNNAQVIKDATMASSTNESTACRLMYQGTSRWTYSMEGSNTAQSGCGHHGADYVGVAAVRNGKQLFSSSAPQLSVTNRSVDSKQIG